MSSTVAQQTESASAVTAVVISLLGGSALKRLVTQLESLGVPSLIVARNASDVDGISGRRSLISDQPVPMRRAIGFRETSSMWVLLVEDTCLLGASWPDCLSKLAHLPNVDAVAGPIGLSSALPARFMALACVEYGEFSPTTATSADVTRLPGLCVLYRRNAVSLKQMATALIEPEVQSSILDSNRCMRFDHDFRVFYDARDEASARWSQRFAHGRIFGGTLRRRAGFKRRAKSLIGAPVLPMLLSWRACSGIPRDHAQRFRTACFILHYAIAWTLGEVCGVLLGSPADTRRWH